MNNGRSIFSGISMFVCIGGAELAGFTMLNGPNCNRPLVTVPGRFMDRSVGAALNCFYGSRNIGGASAAEPGIAQSAHVFDAYGKSEVALTLALPIGILGLQIKTAYIFLLSECLRRHFDRLAQEGNKSRLFHCIMDYGR